LKRLLVVVAASTLSTAAHAGGLYFADRGVRPLARGGAFVAGADDLGAMWYNPAGLADAQGTFLADASFMLFSADFTRRTQSYTSLGVPVVYDYPSVHGDGPPLAIPGLGMAFPVGAEHQWTFGFGAFAPYAPLLRWPETITDPSSGAQSPSPSRYSLVSLEGSLLAVLDLFGAYKFSDEWRVGAGLEMLTGVFQDTVDLGAAPPGLLAAPQDPNYDALSRTRATIFTPSGNLGVTWIPSKIVRFGLSGQLPFWIDAPASVRVRLPNAAVFDNASQVGEDAGVTFRLPAHLRAGVEVRPNPATRVELSYEHQFWSLHDTIDITPHDIQLTGVTALPSPYIIPKISIPRHFQDCDSVHLGGEYRIDLSATTKLDLRLGFAFETSAVPTAYESPLTVDGNKLTFAGGAGLTIDRTRIDAMFAYVYMLDVDVPPDQAAIAVVNPVSGYPPPPGPPNGTVNGGHYSASAPIIGVGIQYTFGSKAPPPRKHEPSPPRHEPPPTEPPPPPKPPPEAAPTDDQSAEPPPPPRHHHHHHHHHHKHKKHTQEE
jgi:long-chain fatty acid transport protein